MIKGLLFDYDGVMTAKNVKPAPSLLLARALQMGHEPVQPIFEELWPDYVRGRMDETAFWRRIEEMTGTSVATQDRAIWSTWEDVQVLPEMCALVADMRSRGCRAGLLTNVTPGTELEIRTNGGYDGFDFTVKSCLVGVAKPDPEIYDMAMVRFGGLAPQEVVFIDDKEPLLEPARDLGMRTLLAVSPQQVISDIRNLVG